MSVNDRTVGSDGHSPPSFQSLFAFLFSNFFSILFCFILFLTFTSIFVCALKSLGTPLSHTHSKAPFSRNWEYSPCMCNLMVVWCFKSWPTLINKLFGLFPFFSSVQTVLIYSALSKIALQLPVFSRTGGNLDDLIINSTVTVFLKVFSDVFWRGLFFLCWHQTNLSLISSTSVTSSSSSLASFELFA